MKASIRNKLDTLAERLEEINALLSDSETIADNNKFRELSKEYAQLNPVIIVFNNYRSALDDLETAQSMLEEDDADMREMAEEEIKSSKKVIEELEAELH